MTDVRRSFYEPSYLIHEVDLHLHLLDEKDRPDFLTFVSNGEPTLDIHIGKEIELMQTFQIPVAVITNGSLLYDKQVRQDLLQASWVSVKVDAGNPAIQKSINRSLPSFSFDQYVEGLVNFSREFQGQLVTETMIVDGVNDSEDHLKDTIQLITGLNPEKAYISIPTRPPAVRSVKPPPEESIVKAYSLFSQAGLSTELLTGFEGTSLGYTGNIWNDILNIITE